MFVMNSAVKNLTLIFSFISVLQFGFSFPASAQKPIRFPARDGVKITADHYVLHKDSSYIILCHKGGSSRGEYNEIAERLGKLGYNCLAIDLRSGNEFNFKINETAMQARQRGLPTDYMDAEADIIDAMEFVQRLSNKPMILVGSEFSASLALKLASENDIISSVVAFSPGEYFGSLVSIQQLISGLDIPIFVTCAAKEVPYVKELVSGITSKKLRTFYPAEGGKQGVASLFKENPNNQEYWINLLNFMRSLRK